MSSTDEPPRSDGAGSGCAPKKHPCPDCSFCQWCSDDRCALCRDTGKGCKRKLSTAEQIALYEKVNRKDAGNR